MHYIKRLSNDNNNNILLLQGPNGRFFFSLAAWLREKGKTVFKVNFNGGDEYFYPSSLQNTYNYTGTLDGFNAYLNHFIQQHQIDAVVCFGDNRHYHRVAKAVVKQLDSVSFWVFEEGYFRPFYITLEKDGVNAFSPLPREIDFFLAQARSMPDFPPAVSVKGGFKPMADKAIRYYIAMALRKKRYACYQHHRDGRLWHFISLWTVSAFRRINYSVRDAFFARKIQRGKLGKFFILPLQVYNDSQVLIHSDFDSVEACLTHILTSFALHAEADCKLVVKHHPMDRGFIDYRRVIKTSITQYPQLNNRVIYIHDIPLPVLLRNGVGMATMNSTAGISALIHHLPVKVVGRAHYNINGLTYQGKLDDFWQDLTPPNPDYFHAYHLFHMHTTQINGSYYSEVKLPK